VRSTTLAGVGAISVLASQTIGDPAETLKLFTSALREYERAADVTRSMFSHNSNEAFFSAVGHFERCSSISEAGFSRPIGATQSIDAHEAASCVDD
jgi:hypothetical protein